MGVDVVRAFPVSDPHSAITIVSGEAKEIEHFSSIDELPGALRESVERELSLREFVPVIRRILNRPPDKEPAEWKVETDRGVTTFSVESDSDVHCNGPHRVTIVDSHGIRYMIPDRRTLDPHSRRVLDRFAP